MTLTTGRDINGNPLLRIKIGKERAFSVQVNGEVLHTQYRKLIHNEPLTEQDHQNIRNYIKCFGTDKQKKLI